MIKRRIGRVEHPQETSIFLTKSSDHILIYREIQSILRLAINSWAHLEANWIILTHQSIQNKHLQHHNLLLVLEFDFDNIRIINEF